jgi:hypothetical protein
MTDDKKTDEPTDVEQQDDERDHPEVAPDTLDGDQLDPVPDA